MNIQTEDLSIYILINDNVHLGFGTGTFEEELYLNYNDKISVEYEIIGSTNANGLIELISKDKYSFLLISSIK